MQDQAPGHLSRTDHRHHGDDGVEVEPALLQQRDHVIGEAGEAEGLHAEADGQAPEGAAGERRLQRRRPLGGTGRLSVAAAAAKEDGIQPAGDHQIDQR